MKRLRPRAGVLYINHTAFMCCIENSTQMIRLHNCALNYCTKYLNSKQTWGEEIELTLLIRLFLQDHMILSSDLKDCLVSIATITCVRAEEGIVGGPFCSLLGLFILFSHWTESCTGRGVLEDDLVECSEKSRTCSLQPQFPTTCGKVTLGLITGQAVRATRP